MANNKFRDWPDQQLEQKKKVSSVIRWLNVGIFIAFVFLSRQMDPNMLTTEKLMAYGFMALSMVVAIGQSITINNIKTEIDRRNRN
ncbi:MAG: hypothetical protein AAGJ18_16230 [Bacteroidota bacterium]